MMQMPLSEIAKQLGCQNTSLGEAKGVSIDTRTLQSGNLYIALRGEQFDAHDFVKIAAQKGAAAALVSRVVDAPIAQLKVDDTLAALGKLSAHWRDHFSVPIVGVTGSNGKTTLKNMIASILKADNNGGRQTVLATEGNLNNNIGLPLTLLRLTPQHRFAVIEMGMNHLGEIAYLTRLARPTVAVINNAAESHLEGLHTVEKVAQAKGEILQGLNKEGIAILNRDDKYFNYWQQLANAHTLFTFGLKNTADISADITNFPKTTLVTPKGTISLTLPLLGMHNVRNALAATAVAFALDIDLSAIKIGLENMAPAPGRMRPYVLENGTVVIDDTYNANPFSLQAALSTLIKLDGPKIMVLGDMRELGAEENAIHFAAGQQILAAGIDYLFTFGKLSAVTGQAFGKNAWHFNEQEKLIAALAPYLQQKSTLLIKGSRSMKMENILNMIVPHTMLEPHH